MAGKTESGHFMKKLGKRLAKKYIVISLTM
jgi:hypothetical protein